MRTFSAKSGKENVVFYDVEQAPFRIYGVTKENGKFRRIPEELARNVNDNVYARHANTTGGRVRFVTDSAYVVIHVEEVCDFSKTDRCCLSGAVGLDLYEREGGIEKYRGTFAPPLDIVDGYEKAIDFPDRTERILTINMPMYSDVTKLYVGLEEGASLKAAPDYTYETPVVFYGSSITQGLFVSRPGNTYENFLSRWFDCNYTNLGFGAGAKGEENITEWICGLDMKAFVMDYDHNAPTVAHLEATHEKMFQAIRKVHPDLPVLIMSRPKFYLSEEEQRRRSVIFATYEHAVAAGDQNVYFLDGPALMEEVEDNGTTEGLHPTDAGFHSMAKAIKPILAKMLLVPNTGDAI